MPGVPVAFNLHGVFGTQHLIKLDTRLFDPAIMPRKLASQKRSPIATRATPPNPQPDLIAHFRPQHDLFDTRGKRGVKASFIPSHRHGPAIPRVHHVSWKIHRPTRCSRGIKAPCTTRILEFTPLTPVSCPGSARVPATTGPARAVGRHRRAGIERQAPHPCRP